MLENSVLPVQEIYSQGLPYLQYFLLAEQIDRISNDTTRILAGKRWFYDLGVQQAALINQAQLEQPDFPMRLENAIENAYGVIDKRLFFPTHIQAKSTQDAIIQPLILLGYEGGGEVSNYFTKDIAAIARLAGWVIPGIEEEIGNLLKIGIGLKNGKTDIPESFFYEGRREKRTALAQKLQENISFYEAATKFGIIPRTIPVPPSLEQLKITFACFQTGKAWEKIERTLRTNPEPGDNRPIYFPEDY